MNLRVYRKQARLSQKELGEMIGLSGAAVCHYEIGRSAPTPAGVQAIIAALKTQKVKVSFNDLFPPT